MNDLLELKNHYQRSVEIIDGIINRLNKNDNLRLLKAKEDLLKKSLEQVGRDIRAELNRAW